MMIWKLVLFSFFIYIQNINTVSSKVLFIEESLNFNGNWLDPNIGEEESFKKVVRVINRSKAGKDLLQRAKMKASLQGETLLDILKVGEISVSDTTLLRKFYPQNPDKIIYETRSKVFVNRDLNLMDAVLDLSHELVHYSFRSAFNPYQDNFNLVDFIKSTIEGKGGEVDAYLMECRLLKDLFDSSNRYSSNCKKLYNSSKDEFSRDKGIELFYQVGEYYKASVKAMDAYGESSKMLERLSSSDAIYISSAYGLPYPLAAIKEFMSIMDRVCLNDQKRLSLIKKKVARRPASVDKEYKLQNIEKDYLAFQKRCQKHI